MTFASHSQEPGQLARVAVIVGLSKRSAQTLMQALSQQQDIVHRVFCDTINDARDVLLSYPSPVIFASLSTLTLLSNMLVDGSHVVVTGATDEDALSAFRANADSFLRLPVDTKQLQLCLDNVRQRARHQLRRERYQQICEGLCKQFGINQQALAAMLRRQCASRERPNVVGLRTGNEWCCLQPDDIRWIEAAGDYMCIYTSDDNHIVRSTMAELLRRLDNGAFLRANRSMVVNLKKVRRLVCEGPAVHYLEMTDGTRLKISRRCYITCWQNRSLD